MEADNPYSHKKRPPSPKSGWQYIAWNEGYQKCLDTVVVKLRVENAKLREALRGLREYQKDGRIGLSSVALIGYAQLMERVDELIALTTEPEECVWPRAPYNDVICPHNNLEIDWEDTPEKCPHCHKPVRIVE